MKTLNNITSLLQHLANRSGRMLRGLGVLFLVCASLCLTSCERKPLLHLHDDGGDVNTDIPLVDLDLDVLWDYEFEYGIDYNWEAEWYYGWDATDSYIFGGTIGYREPNSYNVLRYFTGNIPYLPHNKSPLKDKIYGKTLHTRFDWGFWDILVWSDVIPDAAGVQSLVIDDESSLDYVTAYTNMSMNPAHYNAPAYSRAFYQPEELFAAYEEGVEINRDLEGFEYDSIRNVYVKKLMMELEPVTYIYLTQIVLHHNNGKVTGTDGNANLSGMARDVKLNDGVTGNVPITVHYNNRFKRDCEMEGENVDIVGGRVMTFGMTNLNPNRIPTRAASYAQQRVEEADRSRHYIDATLQFNNGKDSIYVWDVTDQVRKRFRGGVLTVEVDVDTLKIPFGHPGSGFDAVVKDWEEEYVPEISL